MAMASLSEDIMRDENVKIKFDVENPHRPDTKAYSNYEMIKCAATVGEAREKGASLWDLKGYFRKGVVVINKEVVDADFHDGMIEENPFISV